MVQHYFRTKDEMMTFALEVVSENVQARLAARAAEYNEPPSPQGVVRGLLIEMLPLDEPRRLEGHVGLAFHAYAAVKPIIAVGLRQDTERMLVFLTEQIRAAQRTGNAFAELDPDHEARTCWPSSKASAGCDHRSARSPGNHPRRCHMELRTRMGVPTA